MHGSIILRLIAFAILAFLFLPAANFAADDYTQGPVLVEIPKQREVPDQGIYKDVLAYSVEPTFGDAHGRPTNVHETAHGIHATYRNKYTSALKKRVNALYMLEGRIALVKEPDFLIRHIAREIPVPLRGYRYQLYFVEQLKYWDDRPIYVFDEWTAYICGGECAVDDFARTGEGRGADSVSGCLEFSLYAVSTYLTAKLRDPDYLEREPQFKRVLYYNLTRAEQTFYAGREVFRSAKQEALYNALQTHPDAAPVRDCLRDEFDGMFLMEVPHEIEPDTDR